MAKGSSMEKKNGAPKWHGECKKSPKKYGSGRLLHG